MSHYGQQHSQPPLYDTGLPANSYNFQKHHQHQNASHHPMKKQKGNSGVSRPNAHLVNHASSLQGPYHQSLAQPYYPQPFYGAPYLQPVNPTPVPPPLPVPPPPPGWKPPSNIHYPYQHLPGYHNSFLSPQGYEHQPQHGVVPPPPPQYWGPHVAPQRQVSQQPHSIANVGRRHAASPRSNHSSGNSVTAPQVPSPSTSAQSNHVVLQKMESFDPDDAGQLWLGGETEGWFHEEKEPSNPQLTLGAIDWKPGNYVEFAIAATYAEFEASEPPKNIELKSNASISRYARLDCIEEQCRPIWETAWWSYMKDDPIFSDFGTPDRLVSFQALMANRDRMGSGQEQMNTERSSESIEYEPSIPAQAGEADVHLLNGNQENADDDGDPEDEEEYSPPPLNAPLISSVQSPDPVQHTALEAIWEEQPGPQAQPNDETNMNSASNEVGTKADQAQTNGTDPRKALLTAKRLDPSKMSDVKSQDHAVSLPAKPMKRSGSTQDEAQEALLAQLGVTGSPKPVFPTPGPAFIARKQRPPGRRSRSRSPSKPVRDTNNSVHLMGAVPSTPIPPPPPPPPPPPGEPLPMPYTDRSLLRTTAFGQDGSGDSPRSATSQHTLAGSDFGFTEPFSSQAEAQEGFNAKPQSDPMQVDKAMPEADTAIHAPTVKSKDKKALMKQEVVEGVKTRKRARQEAGKADEIVENQSVPKKTRETGKRKRQPPTNEEAIILQQHNDTGEEGSKGTDLDSPRRLRDRKSKKAAHK